MYTKSEFCCKKRYYKVNFSKIDKDTNKTYYVRAISRAGIKGDASSICIKVRKSTPKTPYVKVASPNNYGWYTNEISKKDISFKNEETDIHIETYAKIWNARTEDESKAEIIKLKCDSNEGINDEVISKLKDEGIYKMRIYTVDEAGNQSDFWPENSEGYSVNIDYTKPSKLQIQYLSQPVAGIDGYDIFNSNCVVRIYSKDDVSGIKEIKYHLENEFATRTVVLSGDVKQDEDRQYVQFSIEPQYKGKVIIDSVINNAGLESTINSFNSLANNDGIENIIVDAEKPSKPLISSGKYINNTWTKDNVSLRVEGSKALSGIKCYRYIVNNGEFPTEAEWNNSAILRGNFENNVRILTGNENLVAETINFGCDLNKTYWVRAEGNSGILGEISNYNIKIQKSAPRNTTIQYDEANSEGWYKKSPCIQINNIDPLEGQAPIHIYYKLWSETLGQTEESVNEVFFNGSNLPQINNDGKYKLRVWTVDEVGNRSARAEDIIKDFNCDYTMPVITLDYDNNNSMNEKYFNKSRNAILTINDDNFNSEKVNIKVISLENGNVVETTGNSWNESGISHSTVISFDTDGDYKIEAVCSDKADNKSNTIESSDFVIDTTSPTLEISNVRDLSANNKDVNPIIEFNDTNIDFNNVEYTVTGLKNGNTETNSAQSVDGNARCISLSSIEKDDNYILLAKATDKAGNSLDKKVTFSVNKNGSTFEYLNNNIKNGYVTESFKPQIRINNIDEVNILSLTLNGEPAEFTYEDGILTFNDDINTYGKYIINLDCKDAAGNINSMEPIEFMLDTSKPKILIDGVENGKSYSDKIKITVSKDNSYDKFDYIKLNGEDMIQSGVANLDGSVTFEVSEYDDYKLEIMLSDQAGNVTNESISFKISESIFGKSSLKRLTYLIMASVVIIAGILFVRIKLKKAKI